jgi:hypothetical protein
MHEVCRPPVKRFELGATPSTGAISWIVSPGSPGPGFELRRCLSLFKAWRAIRQQSATLAVSHGVVTLPVKQIKRVQVSPANPSMPQSAQSRRTGFHPVVSRSITCLRCHLRPYGASSARLILNQQSPESHRVGMPLLLAFGVTRNSALSESAVHRAVR